MNTFEILEQDLIVSAVAEDGFEAHFNPRDDFPPFKGHFPDFKIMPGVAQISLITAAMRKRFGEKVCLAEIQRVKFTNPALPGMDLDIAVKLTFSENGFCVVQAKLSGNDKPISNMKLLYGNVFEV